MDLQRLDERATIVALSSPPGFAARGVLRLSGPAAFAIADRGWEPAADPPRDRPPRRVRGIYRVEGFRVPIPAARLERLGPRSYTGQDLVEIHTEGSPPVLDRLLAHFLGAGARPAERGEFTLRAFLAGRLDLARAEAVLGVIHAETPAQLDRALNQLAGGLSEPIRTLRDRLLDLLAFLEANLDFAEESDVDELTRAELGSELAEAAARIDRIADTLRARARDDRRPRVVLAGPPNAGKSRLFNALVGADRALVSPRAGTTRDYVSAIADCAGLEVELIDTAGFQPDDDPIMARARELREQQRQSADLELLCHPADIVPDPDPDAPELDADPTPEEHLPVPRLRVRTKADLRPAIAEPNPKSELFDAIPVSAMTGEGLDRLRAAIRDRIRAERDADDPTPTGARCASALREAGDALRNASGALLLGVGEELVAIDLRQAVDALGRVLGLEVEDDVLDRIFSRFCIGK